MSGKKSNVAHDGQAEIVDTSAKEQPTDAGEVAKKQAAKKAGVKPVRAAASKAMSRGSQCVKTHENSCEMSLGVYQVYMVCR